MPGQILKSDIITNDAIQALAAAADQFDRIAASAEAIDKALPKASFGELSKLANQANENTKKLTTTTQNFQSIVKLGRQQYKEEAAAQKKSETEKRKELRKTEQEEKRILSQRQRLAKLIIQARQSEAGSLTRLNALNKVYAERMKNLNVLIPKQAAQYKKLNASMMANQKAMLGMAAGAKKGSSQFNMLQWQIMQVSRELPAFAYGINVGIGALSNNLPMLFDEINKVRKANKLLAAEGKATTSVLKQIGASVLSWQTALVAAVTVFTFYGKDIINWISSLVKGTEAVDDLVDAQKQLNEAQIEGSKNAQKEAAKLGILYKATQDQSKSMKDRVETVEELQRLYPEYLGNFTKESVLAGDAYGAYVDLNNSLRDRAKSLAVFSKLVANNVASVEKEVEANRLYSEILKAEDERQALRERKRKGGFSSTKEIDDNIERTNELNVEIGLMRAEWGKINNEVVAYRKANEELLAFVDVKSLFRGGGGGTRMSEAAEADLPELERVLNSSLDSYKAHYIKRKAEARNDAEELVNIEKEMILNLLYEDAKYMNLTISEREKLFADLLKLGDEYRQIQSDKAISGIYEQADKERIALSQGYSQQLIDLQNRASRRKTVETKLAIELLQVEYDAQQAIIDSVNTTADAKADAAKKQAQLEEELQKQVRKGVVETEKLKREEFSNTISVLSEATNAGFELGAAVNERAIAYTERRYELETQAAGDNLFKQLSAQRKYENEIAKLKKRQAIASKASAAFDVVVNTARAIMETLGQTGLFGVPLTPIIAGIGALQLATVLAQPIPQFAEGVENFEGGPAIVGDKKGNPTKPGGQELALFPDGTMALTPSTPTVMNLPAGTDIIPNDKVASTLANSAIQSTYEMIDMSSTNSVLRRIEKNTGGSVTTDGRYKYVNKRGLKGRYRI